MGFGAAVAMATAAFAHAPGLASTRSDSGAVVEWLWLLHDDSAPAPQALEAMLELADEMPSAAMIGAKLLGWDNPRLLLEVGATLDRGGRRETWLEPGELDHGQHDGDRDVLAVSTAGMLVRRDVWEDLGGFDPALPLFRDDTDFGWRANLAGHRVVICSRAVLRHAQATTSGLRPICVPTIATAKARPAERALDDAHELFRGVVAMDDPARDVRRRRPVEPFVVAKRPFDAWDEMRATVSVLIRPRVLLRARRARRATRRIPSREVRALVRAAWHAVAPLRRIGARATRRHRASRRRRDHRRPRALPPHRHATWRSCWYSDLLIVSLVAERHVLKGTLHGGMLLPAPASASDLWNTYTASWHATGFGSTTDAPPYLAIVAMIGAVLFGSAQLAVKVLLLGSVPIAGLTAYIAARPSVATKRLRVWLAATYALLPVASGSIASGRLGTAVAFAVLPLVC